MKRLLRAHRMALDGFGRALPVINWAFFIVGLLGAVGTAAGLLPPFSGSWWARITTVLLWLLFAREGYDSMAEEDDAVKEALVVGEGDKLVVLVKPGLTPEQVEELQRGIVLCGLAEDRFLVFAGDVELGVVKGA